MYCTVDEIKTDFGNAIEIEASGTKITIAQCEALIESESNFIDSYISSKYTVPVIESDSPKSFLLLKRICIYLVSEKIRRMVEIKSAQTKTDQDAKEKLYSPNRELDKIVQGTLRLLDCPGVSSTDGIVFGLMDPAFKPFSLNKQQW